MVKRKKQESPDPLLAEVREMFAAYQNNHVGATFDAYRYNSASIRVRVIDPEFRGLDRIQREAKVWGLLERLSDDARSDLSLLLLITPDEKQSSLMNLEFEDPTPSRL